MTKMLNRCIDMLTRRSHRGASVLLIVAILLSTFPVTPRPVSAGINDLTQEDYRWYQNGDAVQPTTPLGVENTAITGMTQGGVYRLRMNITNSGAKLDPPATFKLQYSTATTGPWTDVGGIGSTSTWRGFDNPTPSDGDAITSNLLVSSFTNNPQTYEEANDGTIISTINKNKPSEWDWVIQDNSATGGTAYYFRLVISDGTPLVGYTNYPQLTPAVASVNVTESASRPLTSPRAERRTPTMWCWAPSHLGPSLSRLRRMASPV